MEIKIHDMVKILYLTPLFLIFLGLIYVSSLFLKSYIYGILFVFIIILFSTITAIGINKFSE